MLWLFVLILTLFLLFKTVCDFKIVICQLAVILKNGKLELLNITSNQNCLKMNDSLQASRKFKERSATIFLIFLTLTLLLVPMFSYLFNDYWLLFGVVFAMYISKLTKLILISSVGVFLYWYIEGFQFSDKVTFFWFSMMFGFVFQAAVQGFDDLATRIIQNEVSEMTSSITNRIQRRNKSSDNDNDNS